MFPTYLLYFLQVASDIWASVKAEIGSRALGGGQRHYKSATYSNTTLDCNRQVTLLWVSLFPSVKWTDALD